MYLVVFNCTSFITLHSVNNVKTLVGLYESTPHFNAVSTGCEIRRQSLMILCSMTFNENPFAVRVLCKQADSRLGETNNGNVIIHAMKSCRRRSDIAALILNLCGRLRWVLSLTPYAKRPVQSRRPYGPQSRHMDVLEKCYISCPCPERIIAIFAKVETF